MIKRFLLKNQKCVFYITNLAVKALILIYKKNYTVMLYIFNITSSVNFMIITYVVH